MVDHRSNTASIVDRMIDAFHLTMLGNGGEFSHNNFLPLSLARYGNQVVSTH